MLTNPLLLVFIAGTMVGATAVPLAIRIPDLVLAIRHIAERRSLT